MAYPDGRVETIETTKEHPLYGSVVVQSIHRVDGDATESDTALRADSNIASSQSKPSTTGIAIPPVWTSARPATRSGWVAAHLLKPGDVVDTLSGPGRVVRVQFTDELKPVYNFEIEGLHDYRVGADGVLVHNGICDLVLHHMFPAFRGNAAKQAFWRRVGINPDEWTLLIPGSLNRRVHPQWNKEWEQWITANPEATAFDVWGQMYAMWNKYKLPPGMLERYGRNTQIVP